MSSRQASIEWIRSRRIQNWTGLIFFTVDRIMGVRLRTQKWSLWEKTSDLKFFIEIESLAQNFGSYTFVALLGSVGSSASINSIVCLLKIAQNLVSLQKFTNLVWIRIFVIQACSSNYFINKQGQTRNLIKERTFKGKRFNKRCHIDYALYFNLVFAYFYVFVHALEFTFQNPPLR